MKDKIIILIGILGVAACGVAVFLLTFGNTTGTPPTEDAPRPSGTAYANVPWKHFPNVSRFQFTDQTDQEFDSASLAGKPYAVSFFFASCPTICKDLNRTVERVNGQLKNEEIAFVTISVDPENDTPEVLARYAEDFGATPDRWSFLTGPAHRVTQLGAHQFRVVVDRDTHTDNILLVDKWGRYRDRFKWDDAYDMKRFVKVAKVLAAETEPPLDQSFETRNVLAGVEPPELSAVPWIRDFHLTERNGNEFYSGDMTGRVWIANFFFSQCPGICQKQNEYLQGLQSRLEEHETAIVSISTDPRNDTPEKLAAYANKFGASKTGWLFCTGKSETLIRRVSSEYFAAHSSEDHHSSLLFLVDRWGNVRGEFDWQDAGEEAAMLEMISELKQETVPPAKFIKRKS